MQTDYLAYIFQAINTLLTQHLGFFDAMGQNLFRSFATILVAWYGIKSALASASGSRPFQFDHFASLLLTISFGFAMATYYTAPIPGIGASFHNLVTNEAQFLSTKIDEAELQIVVQSISDFESRMDSPTWGDILGSMFYVVTIILLAAAQAVAFVIIAYGFIASAVCVLLGPLFVPFFIVPKLEWLFWGWLRSFLQYAFYQVVASAVVFIVGNLIVGALRLPPKGTLSTVQLIAWFPVLLVLLVASVYTFLKIPVLTNHIFSGTAGGSTARIVERVFE